MNNLLILAMVECTEESLYSVFVIVRFILTVIQWVAPIILIIIGSIDMVKAIVAGKEDEIKKNQQTLIKRLISAVIIFLIPLAVSIIMGWVGNTNWKSCWGDSKDGDLKELIEGVDQGAQDTNTKDTKKK